MVRAAVTRSQLTSVDIPAAGHVLRAGAANFEPRGPGVGLTPVLARARAAGLYVLDDHHRQLAALLATEVLVVAGASLALVDDLHDHGNVTVGLTMLPWPVHLGGTSQE